MSNSLEISVTSKSGLVSSNVLRINVRGCGNTPSFKNRKRAIQDSKTGKLRTLTERKVAQRKSRIQAVMLSELISVFATFDPEISTAVRQQYLMRLLPPDDNWKVVCGLNVTGSKCNPGEEGFTITIERLT